MKVYLASDHAGFELKGKLIEYVKSLGYEAIDKGAFTLDPADDYPDFISEATREVSNDPDSRAVIIGGSGQGEAIVANRFANVRAAVYYGGNPEIIKLSRDHNDANILSLGARFVSEDEAGEVVKAWLEAPFSNDERHIRRIKKIEECLK